MTDPTTRLHDSRGTHTCPLETPRTFLGRLMTATGHGLQQVRLARGLDVVELAVGFPGSEVTTAVVSASDEGVTARHGEMNFDDVGEAATWEPLVGLDDGGPVGAAIRGGSSTADITSLELTESEKVQLMHALETGRQDHLHATVADAPSGWSSEPADPSRQFGSHSKQWIYDLFAHLPSLCGVDSSAALVLPDHRHDASQRSHYIVGAELHFVHEPLQGEPPEHLVGLLIPLDNPGGGIIANAVSAERSSDRRPLSVYEPVGDRIGAPWREIGREDGTQDVPCPCFVGGRRGAAMLVLVPLELPDTGPGFIALSYKHRHPLAGSTVAILDKLSTLVSNALAHSDLYQIPVARLKVFEGLAKIGDSTSDLTRTELVSHLSRELFASLDAASVAIGLLGGEASDPTLHFPSPQGWDLDSPRTLHYLTSDSLATLALRMDRQIVLAGGHQSHPSSPALRWTNSLYVDEASNHIADARYPHPDGVDLLDSPQWRALADYYKPTTPSPIYAAVAWPLKIGEVMIGVLVMDFDRHTPWDAYSGFAVEALYGVLARLIASLLSMVHTD